MTTVSTIFESTGPEGLTLADNLEHDLAVALEMSLREFLDPDIYDLPAIADTALAEVVQVALNRLADVDLDVCRTITRPDNLTSRFDSEADNHLLT